MQCLSLMSGVSVAGKMSICKERNVGLSWKRLVFLKGSPELGFLGRREKVDAVSVQKFILLYGEMRFTVIR